MNPFNLENWRTESIRVGTDAGDFKNKLKEYFENYQWGMEDHSNHQFVRVYDFDVELEMFGPEGNKTTE